MENLEKSVEQALKNNLVTIVVSASEVEARSNEGYRLAEIVQSDLLSYADETTNDNENGYDGKYGTRQHRVSKPIIIRMPQFVMVLSAFDALAGKQERIRELETLVRDSVRQTEEAVKVSKEQAQLVSSLRADLMNSAKIVQHRGDAIHALENRNRKFEIDMGKMRTALGDLRMKEILGE